MPSYFLAPCGDQLRDEFDALFPNRDKSSDGWIGDARHAASVSDHNPDTTGMVHAIDVDKDLRPTTDSPQTDMAAVVAHLVDRCRQGLEDRLWYVIYQGVIYSRTYGFARRNYTGTNPHDKHAHFSFRYVNTLENDRRPWLAGIVPAKPDSRYTPWSKAAPGSRTVQLWDSGDDVKELQRVVDAWYGEIKLTHDGYFGPATDEAIRLLQTRADLEVDGIAGPKTWAVLGFK
jgi:hypothetical protein